MGICKHAIVTSLAHLFVYLTTLEGAEGEGGGDLMSWMIAEHARLSVPPVIVRGPGSVVVY